MDSVTASTIPTNRPENDAAAAGDAPAVEPDIQAEPAQAGASAVAPHTGSLARRMMLIAAGWITFLLLIGGVALNQTLTGLVTRQFDEQLDYVLTAMIGSAEIDPDGEVWFNRPLGDQRFLEPNSGFYWQISGPGHRPFPRARCGIAR